MIVCSRPQCNTTAGCKCTQPITSTGVVTIVSVCLECDRLRAQLETAKADLRTAEKFITVDCANGLILENERLRAAVAAPCKQCEEQRRFNMGYVEARLYEDMVAERDAAKKELERQVRRNAGDAEQYQRLVGENRGLRSAIDRLLGKGGAS